MFKLLDAQSGDPLGEISQEQIDFLRAQLEEETAEDQDYYINGMTIDVLESNGGDAGLITLLRSALGEKEDIDIRWE